MHTDTFSSDTQTLFLLYPFPLLLLLFLFPCLSVLPFSFFLCHSFFRLTGGRPYKYSLSNCGRRSLKGITSQGASSPCSDLTSEVLMHSARDPWPSVLKFCICKSTGLIDINFRVSPSFSIIKISELPLPPGRHAFQSSL